MREHIFAVAVLVSAVLSPGRALAQNRDSLLNGALIGGAIGAGIGVGFTHAVRDSDLTFGQYAYGGLVFGAIGAGAGLGIDALLNRSPRPVAGRSLVIAPAVGRVNGVAVVWRWGNREERRKRIHTEEEQWRRTEALRSSPRPRVSCKPVTSATSLPPEIDYVLEPMKRPACTASSPITT